MMPPQPEASILIASMMILPLMVALACQMLLQPLELHCLDHHNE